RAKTVDARADLFSLGCVLYEMATGQRPFQGDDAISILSSLALDEPAPPHELNAEISIALSGLIQRLLAKEPEKRPQSAGEVVKILTAMQSPSASETTSINPWEDIDLSRSTEVVAAKSRVKAGNEAPLPFRTRLRIGVAIALAMFLLVGG